MKKIIFTMTRNPGIYFKTWIEYYSRYFDRILVIDDGSTDDEILRYQNVHRFMIHEWEHESKYASGQEMLDIVKQTQSELLKEYDVVVYTDIDEIIYPVNCDLSEYIDNMKSDYVRCRGYDLIDIAQPRYSLSKTVLEQRYHLFYSPTFYSKVLISKVPLSWTIGFHYLEHGQVQESPDLLLIHLHRLDVVDRFQRMVRRWHGRGQEVSMQKFYDHYYKMPYGYINDFKIEPIPDEIRKANKF